MQVCLIYVLCQKVLLRRTYMYGHILLAKGMIVGFSEATCTLYFKN